MFRTRFVVLLASVAVVLALSGCGGGGGPPDSQFRVESTALPEMLSGQPFQHQIPIVGGCGGPYIMQRHRRGPARRS